MRTTVRPPLWTRILLVVLAILVFAPPSWAVLGVRRRTAVVAYSAGAAAGSAAASQQAAAAQQSAAQQSAAQQSAAAQSAAEDAAAAAEQAAAAANQAAAAAAKPARTTQQRLEELQSLYKQGLINEKEYEEQKAKVLAEAP